MPEVTRVRLLDQLHQIHAVAQVLLSYSFRGTRFQHITVQVSSEDDAFPECTRLRILVHKGPIRKQKGKALTC